MANFPTSVSTDANLYVAANNAYTTLSSGIGNADTSLSCASTASFPTTGVILIESEICFYTGKTASTLTGLTRGADGTTAASHSASKRIELVVAAKHHNGLKDEIIAIETALTMTASRAVVTSAGGIPTASAVTATTLGYLDATSSVQTQLNAKASLNAAAATGAWTFDTSTIVVDPTNHRVGIGEASPAAILHIKAATNAGTFESTGDYSQINIKDSTKSCYIGTYHGDFRVGVNDGGIASQSLTLTTAGYLDVPGIYAETTALAANVVVAADGSIQRSTSSLKYKKDIRDVSVDAIEKIFNLRPVVYKSRQEMDGDRDFLGIIAEEADAAGLGILVSYGADGKPDGFMYERVVVPLIAIVKNMQERIIALEGKTTKVNA